MGALFLIGLVLLDVIIELPLTLSLPVAHTFEGFVYLAQLLLDIFALFFGAVALVLQTF